MHGAKKFSSQCSGYNFLENINNIYILYIYIYIYIYTYIYIFVYLYIIYRQIDKQIGRQAQAEFIINK